jgi:hypothetical protein
VSSVSNEKKCIDERKQSEPAETFKNGCLSAVENEADSYLAFKLPIAVRNSDGFRIPPASRVHRGAIYEQQPMNIVDDVFIKVAQWIL